MASPKENFINGLVNDIKKGLSSIDDGFIKYYINCIALNPKYGKYITKNASKEDNEVFVKSCIDCLLNDKSPSILSMKMQNHFEEHYDSPDNLIEKNQNNINQRTEPLLKEIVHARPNSQEEHEKLLRRISIYLVLKSGLGNPGNIQVLREGTAALHSVFTMDDLLIFIDQRNAEKERQLQELLSIVSGIRIFNKDCGKGGESIPELTVNLTEAVEATGLALSHCLIRIMERVNLLTTSIDMYIVISPDNGTININIPEDRKVDIKDYKHVCKILSMYRQYEVFVRKLISSMDKIRVDNKEVVLNFSGKLYDLHSLVRYRTAVPADQVFPIFIQLWQFWRQMQNDMFLVSTVNSIMWNLDTCHEQMTAPHSVMDALLHGRQVVSDAQRMRQTQDLKIEPTNNRCLVIYPNEKAFEDMKLQYLGFCALCISIGALIPANPGMGLCKWAGAYYVYCSPQHAKQFGSSPDRYVKETFEYVRNNPEMIHFLEIYEEIYAVRHMTYLVTKPVDIIKTEEKETQTELHPIPTNIDRDYMWNIWDYKKKACHLANIVNCKTHSTQTHYSMSKLEFGCQTNNMRDKNLQTVKEEGTSMPAIQNLYLFNEESLK